MWKLIFGTLVFSGIAAEARDDGTFAKSVMLTAPIVYMKGEVLEAMPYRAICALSEKNIWMS